MTFENLLYMPPKSPLDSRGIWGGAACVGIGAYIFFTSLSVCDHQNMALGFIVVCAGTVAIIGRYKARRRIGRLVD